MSGKRASSCLALPLLSSIPLALPPFPKACQSRRLRHARMLPHIWAIGITAHLKYNRTLEKAVQMANHASPGATHIFDRHNDEVACIPI